MRTFTLLANGAVSTNGCGACWYCLDEPARGFQNPTMQRMILCPTCGNKRCPKATHHDRACTNSNEPGQAGSRYGSGE